MRCKAEKLRNFFVCRRFLDIQPRMDNDPPDPDRRVLGITTDTWMLIGQLAGLLVLAVALVALQSLL